MAAMESIYTKHPAAAMANHAGNAVSPGAVPKFLSAPVSASKKVSHFPMLTSIADTITATTAFFIGELGSCKQANATEDMLGFYRW